MHDAITYRGAVYPWHCDHMGHLDTEARRAVAFAADITAAIRADMAATRAHALPAA